MNLGQKCRHICCRVPGVQHGDCKMANTDQVCKEGKEGEKREGGRKTGDENWKDWKEGEREGGRHFIH